MITLDSNIRQRVNSLVHDNSEFIAEAGGNVAEWLLASVEAQGDYEWYLSIEDRASDFDRAELIEAVEDFIRDNYDYNLNIGEIEQDAAISLYISDRQIKNFLQNVDDETAEEYTVYECAETPGIYFLGCGTVNAHTQPFENLGAEDGYGFIRLISKQKSELVAKLFQHREVEYV